MNTKMEKRILKGLLKCINSQSSVLKKQKIMKYVFFWGPLIFLTIYYGVLQIKNEELDGIIGLIVGISIGLSILFTSSYNQTPIITKYLKKDEIEKRLNELKLGNKP